jgi:hypothetical protein
MCSIDTVFKNTVATLKNTSKITDTGNWTACLFLNGEVLNVNFDYFFLIWFILLKTSDRNVLDFVRVSKLTTRINANRSMTVENFNMSPNCMWQHINYSTANLRKFEKEIKASNLSHSVCANWAGGRGPFPGESKTPAGSSLPPTAEAQLAPSFSSTSHTIL